MRHPPTDWFYAPEARETRSDDSTDSKGNPSGHGSCVASKAAGAIYGVSKNSKLVIVKSSLLQGDIVYSFSKVLDDIIDRNRQRKTVVVFAATSNGNSEDWSWRRVKSSIEDLIAADAVIIVPSGNRAAFHRRAKDVFTFPAVWEAPDFPLIVAGAVENDGTESVYSQGPRHVTTWAPGKVTCAKPSSGTASDIGTSFSTGMVSVHLRKFDKRKIDEGYRSLAW